LNPRVYALFRGLYVFYLGFANIVVNRIPVNWLRVWIYRHLYFMKIGKGTLIRMGVEIRRPRAIRIGDYSIINGGCMLDGRAGMTIGSNVDIGDQVRIYCGGHDVHSPDYRGVKGPVSIGDRACILARSTILRGLDIGEGAVVGACSVVLRDVPPYTIVAGNPARVLGERTRNLTYTFDRRTVNKTW